MLPFNPFIPKLDGIANGILTTVDGPVFRALSINGLTRKLKFCSIHETNLTEKKVLFFRLFYS